MAQWRHQGIFHSNTSWSHYIIFRVHGTQIHQQVPTQKCRPARFMDNSGLWLSSQKNQNDPRQSNQNQDIRQIQDCGYHSISKDVPQNQHVHVIGKIHSQIRGSCIGNPSSPPISEVPIAFKEFMWQEIFNVIINNTLFACRYVDNRLLCLPNHVDCLPHWRILSDLFFYDHPVELEKEPAMTFLGFDIDIHQGTVQYVYPKNSWNFRSPKSAGKTSILLSGLVSRVHLIARHSYPEDLVKPTIKQLIKLYINIGFTNDQIIACIKKTLKQYDIRKHQVTWERRTQHHKTPTKQTNLVTQLFLKK